MYSTIHDGKVLDWHFRKTGLEPDKKDRYAWNFYIGDIFIGQIFPMPRNRWSAVPWHTQCPYGSLEGFSTRHDACEYMLRACGFHRG
jgi:hypothetical protein